MMRLLLTLYLAGFLVSISAQDPTPPENVYGQDLRTWLMDNWYSPWHTDLGYSPARELMFGTIDAEGGLVTCIYTGFTQPASVTTFPDPINTEHTVPQSLFNSQLPMRSDLHHLYPTHMLANTRRGSLPFGENPDNQVDEWLVSIGNTYSESSSIPSSDINDYSEVIFNEAFEPREVQKGNVARAIFYFYTMYPETEGGIEAIAELNTLYDWHQMDPPDALEVERDEEIQMFQGNYNPYIRIPELVGPAWGFVTSLEEVDEIFVSLHPNPTQDILRVKTDAQVIGLQCINVLGQEEVIPYINGVADVRNLCKGIYVLCIATEKGPTSVTFVKE